MYTRMFYRWGSAILKHYSFRNMTIAIGFMTAFPLLLAMMFSMDNDISAALGSQLPMAEIFFEITRSRLVTQFIMVWVTIVLYCRFPIPPLV